MEMQGFHAAEVPLIPCLSLIRILVKPYILHSYVHLAVFLYYTAEKILFQALFDGILLLKNP